MQTRYPVFHAEYWVYVLAAVVIVGMGTLLYTVDGPIKFSSWFCRSLALASTSDDAKIGLCSLVRPAAPSTRPTLEKMGLHVGHDNVFWQEARSACRTPSAA
jgi:hypothetical protein